jgi:hypothetical protein
MKYLFLGIAFLWAANFSYPALALDFIQCSLHRGDANLDKFPYALVKTKRKEIEAFTGSAAIDFKSEDLNAQIRLVENHFSFIIKRSGKFVTSVRSPATLDQPIVSYPWRAKPASNIVEYFSCSFSLSSAKGKFMEALYFANNVPTVMAIQRDIVSVIAARGANHSLCFLAGKLSGASQDLKYFLQDSRSVFSENGKAIIKQLLLGLPKLDSLCGEEAGRDQPMLLQELQTIAQNLEALDKEFGFLNRNESLRK